MKRLIWLVSATALLYAGFNVWQATRLALELPAFWQAQARQPASTQTFRLLALGDSATQAVGAGHPLEGFVGRVATHVQSVTGWPVQITNLSVGGATTGDILRAQLPQSDPAGADLVLVASANDLEQRIPLTQYERNLGALLAALPAERTVISDLPIEPGRAPYQAVLARVADGYRVRRADFAGTFGRARQWLIFSWLPPHLNSRGYGLWFQAFQPAVDDILRTDPQKRKL